MSPPDVIARYCSNPDCSHLKMFGEPRYIGESAMGEYAKIKCQSCKKWQVFNSLPELEDEDVGVISDVVIGASK